MRSSLLVSMFHSVSIEYSRGGLRMERPSIFTPQFVRILYSIHFYKLWSFLYSSRKFAGDVSDFFLKNFPKDDWSEKPNCSAISFTVRSVKTSIGTPDPSGWMYILTVEDFRYLQQQEINQRTSHFRRMVGGKVVGHQV